MFVKFALNKGQQKRNQKICYLPISLVHQKL